MSVDEFLLMLKQDTIYQRNVYTHPWLNRMSNIPIQIWPDTITIQWRSDRDVYKKWINRMVKNSNGLIKSGMFTKSDGINPSTINFYFA